MIMQPFTFHTPTKINFGEDTADGIGDALFDLKASRPLIVTDANLVKSGVLNGILKCLKEFGIEEPVIFDAVPSDSDIGCVRNATALAKKHGCDSIIAIGGGSVLDTAKVTNIGMTLDGDVLEYEGINIIAERLQPLIAIPTTAGTGSEVSAVAMIKDHEDKKKLLFGSRYLFPDVAILDPKLLVSLPPKLTAATGMDALTHAIESFTATTKNAPSDGLCLESMRMIFGNLPKATTDGTDIEARSAMLVGSMMAGVAFTNAGVGIVHALAHAFGGHFGTHHGVTNAIFLPYGMEFNLPEVGEKFAEAYVYMFSVLGNEPDPVGSWFSAIDSGTKKEHADRYAEKLIQAVRNLNVYCKVPTRLKDLGVPELTDPEIEHLADIALTDPAMMFNPRQTSIEDLMDIIKRAY